MKSSHMMSAIVLALGLACGGYFAAKTVRSSSELVEVRGLSERIVKSDFGEITINMSNKNENLDELYKKIVSDKKNVLAFLKTNGVTDSEIINRGLSVYETQDYDNNNPDRKKYFKAEDSVQVRTKEIDKISKIKSKIIDLMSQKVFVSYTYSYKLSTFSEIKLAMMREASEHAKHSAEAFIAPHGRRLGSVVYLKQGEVTIRAEDENAADSYSYGESTSVNKKLRLVVSAGFKKKQW